jgi:FkbM family methyltransferase
MKNVIPESVKKTIKDRLGVPSVEAGLLHLRTNGFTPRVALDIGAYQGEWTVLCKRVWPGCSVLMMEAAPARMPRLRELASTLGGVDVQQALLGSSSRTSVAFYEQESASSVLPESAKAAQPSVGLCMRTLDEATLDTGFAAPDFVKVDVQGYELEVLKGGRKTLQAAEVVLLEVNLLEIYEGAPLLHEALCFMAAEGFRAYDVCTLYRRPLDRALWQMDMIFARNGSRLVASKRYE